MEPLTRREAKAQILQRLGQYPYIVGTLMAYEIARTDALGRPSKVDVQAWDEAARELVQEGEAVQLSPGTLKSAQRVLNEAQTAAYQVARTQRTANTRIALDAILTAYPVLREVSHYSLITNKDCTFVRVAPEGDFPVVDYSNGRARLAKLIHNAKWAS